MDKKISIAIDGPSGAGKSTLARMTAKSLGFIYVDTGALYRSVGLFALRHGTDAGDRAAVTALLPGITLELDYDEKGVQRVFLCGEDVTDAIRTPEVSLAASAVSAIPEVRAFLLETQRDMARRHDVAMDGRDIGTVVLPDADVKIFLTASPEERARRRYRELRAKGTGAPYKEVLRDLLVRDRNDSSRDIAPLRPAEDAILLDTTGNSLRKSFGQIRSIVREKLGK